MPPFLNSTKRWHTLFSAGLTYVNGVWKGAWMNGEAEEAQRFLRPVGRYLHSEKERKELIKIYGGKRCKKADLERINKKLTFWHIDWTSVSAMRRHFEKHNASLEVIRIGPARMTTPAADAMAVET